MRSRNIKPGFYKNEELAECSFEARLLFPGLWMFADREGRMENRPKKIKAEVFPYDNLDVKILINELESNGLVICYESDGGKYIQVVNFVKHQVPHHKEANSVIPAPPGFVQQTRFQYDVPDKVRTEIFNRDGNKCLKCGSFENLSIDHVLSLSEGGNNSTSNLQTLCMRCNSSKGGSCKDYRQGDVNPTLEQRKGNVDDSCRTDILNPESLILNPEPLLLNKDLCEKPEKRKRFVPPSLEEVREYCLERKNSINPESWVDHYLSNGWVIGKSKAPMKDWKASVRTWEKNGNNNKTGPHPIRPYSVKDALTIQSEEIARVLNEDRERKQQRIDIAGNQESSLLVEHPFS